MMDEQQQDANSALMELDKGLRAQKVGQQCEAIVRFPGLFERFPFPILINSAFLKLADVFYIGNNFLRLCILRVSQQSHRHLDKILNVSEFRKRISVVIHSNDPYARAITLRMLGSIACIISDEKSVHHSIRQGLDSHDRVEQEAAIYATIQFASHSREFATSICNKIAAMLQGLSTPLEIKLKLIPVLQHMHYDIQVSSKSRTVLKDLLPAYPAQDFVVATLNTLTNLSTHSLVDIPSQVSLLLQYLRCDPREAVKAVTLRNLNTLAKIGPHLWTTEDTNELCKAYSLTAMQSSLKGAIIQVLCTLASGNTMLHLNLNEGGELINLCRKCCCDRDMKQAALASRLLALLATHAASNQGTASLSVELLKESADAIESLLLVLAPTSDYSQQDRSTLQIILPAIDELCQVCDDDSVMRLMEVVISLLSVDCQPDGEVASMLCEILASVAMKSKKQDLLVPFTSNLMDLLNTVVESGNPGSDEVSSVLQKVITHICTLLFLSNQSRHDPQLGERILTTVTNEDSLANKWTWYRVARQASRIGEHDIASKLFHRLSSAVVSEQYYFWLSALHQFELAESSLLSVFGGKQEPSRLPTVDPNTLLKASQHYQQGLTSLSAAVSPDHPLHFQSKFAKLRCDTLLAHAQLVMTCKQIQLSPPPAIADASDEASTSATHVKEDLVATRYGVLSSQLKECAAEFRAISNKYGDLHITSFDADPSTLAKIDTLQRSCGVMSHAIELVVNSKGQEASSMRSTASFNRDMTSGGNNHNALQLWKAVEIITAKLDKVLRDPSPCLSHIHTDCLLNCSVLLLAVPISFPRYFYQSLQTTTIKLAISPSQRSPNDPVKVDVSERLALKIEGVIRHGGPGGATMNAVAEQKDGKNCDSVGHTGSGDHTFRHVSEIKLIVKTNQTTQGKQQHAHSFKSQDANGNSLERTVKPHNDYFNTQFLLSFPVLGNYNVTVDSSLIDERGICWKSGPSETIAVRSFDDSIRVKTLMQQSQRVNKH